VFATSLMEDAVQGLVGAFEERCTKPGIEIKSQSDRIRTFIATEVNIVACNRRAQYCPS
jgi:hypothetical protein